MAMRAGHLLGEALVEVPDEGDDRQQQVAVAPEGLAEARHLLARDLRAGRSRRASKCTVTIDAEEVEEGGDQRGQGHLAERHAHEVGHDEGGRGHDRRHDLAADGGGGLDGGGEGGPVADPLHHGDREDAVHHDVGHAAPRDRAEERAGEDGDLGGAAHQTAGQRGGEPDEEVADAGGRRGRPRRR